MRVTQGTFSFLPDLTDAEITAQIEYALKNGWAVSVEHTDEPHPRNVYWEMWGMPMFDLKDAAGVHDGGRRLPQGVPRTITSRSTRSIRRKAGNRRGSRSSSTGRRTSPASASSARRPPGAASATPIESYAVDRPEGSRY